MPSGPRHYVEPIDADRLRHVPEAPTNPLATGRAAALVELPSGQSYSSFVLMPLLNFAVRARCLFVGGPGRGKTASAVLMGVLGGYSVKEIRRGMQHGHPEMTVADLLGNPLPADLINATSTADTSSTSTTASPPAPSRRC